MVTGVSNIQEENLAGCLLCTDILVNIFSEAERVLRKIQWVHDFYAIGSSCLKMDTKLGAVGAAIKVDEFIYRDASED